jgi:DNA-binding MarR family transcriptional regulator
MGTIHSQNNSAEQILYFLIKRTSKTFRGRINRSFAKAGYDVTSEQWRILTCLWHKDGQRQQDLADLVHKDKTSITRAIDVMEKRNLVVRIPDRLDRRQKLIYLTDKGKRLREELMRIVREISSEAEKGIKPGDLNVFKGVLARIRENLSNL